MFLSQLEIFGENSVNKTENLKNCDNMENTMNCFSTGEKKPTILGGLFKMGRESGVTLKVKFSLLTLILSR